MEIEGQQVSPQMGGKRKGGSGDEHINHIEDSIQSSKKPRTFDDVDDRLLHPFGEQPFDPRYRKVELHLRPMNPNEPHYGSNVDVDLTGHVAVQLEDSIHSMNSQHHSSVSPRPQPYKLYEVHMNSTHEGIQDDSKVNDAGGFISSDNDVGPVAQPVTPEMGHDHHSGKRNREERRSKDKAVVRNFVCMMTDETDEVQKNIPTHMHEQVGIEKNKLWDMFVRFITLPEITPSVFWKYTYGKSRWNNSMEAPVYSNPDFHKEVLKAGVKRLSGVRWRDPSHGPDIEKIRYHNDELLKVGYHLDMETIFKELQSLLKDHDSKKPKLNRPTSHRYIKKPIHQHQQELTAMSIVTQSDAGISSGMPTNLTPIHQATPIDLMTAQQAQNLIELMTNYIHALHQFLSLQGKPNGNNL